MSDPSTLQTFCVATGLVALAEIGDKTQLLSLVLAARYRRPLPIVLGILVATIVNHACAAWIGSWLTALVSPQWLRWIVGAGFIALAGWMLVPDRFDDAAIDRPARTGWQLCWLTTVVFFVAEIGDKTQIATIALAARYADLTAVVAGTTAGMMLANVPAVWFGKRFADRMPVRLVHRIAAAVFLILGIAALRHTGS